jgi:hypothetical protein
MTSNDKTQSQLNAGEVGARESMESKLSQWFELDELDV